ncbi:MAG: hypothetical protein IH591_19810 [Bacteroidales bacterium]|nr:hypothetical protein [Bacteroidales bacterium]
MASVKNLKKDIEYLVFEVVSDSLTFAGLHPGKGTDELSDIIEEAIQLRNDLYARVNNPEKSDDKAVQKEYFKSIRKDLFTGVDGLFDRLSKVTQAN